tara:strand:+ start:464 stop:1264 length:801 start_codon:yes stop_codon:yes gene_type:complete
MLSKIKNKLIFFFRKSLAFNRMEPSFIIIGEARCGTTSLFNYICQNTKVLPPLKKEIHFFDYNFHKKQGWYKSFFPFVKEGKITGEATPYYFSHPKAAKRIKETYPDIKVILVLRNPIDRAISSFYKQRDLKIEPVESIEEAFDIEEIRLKNSKNNMLNIDYDFNHKNYAYVNRGLYYENLERWQSFFDEDQMLIFEFDELFRSLDTNYNRVIEFLDIDKQNIAFKHFNKGTYDNINAEFRIKLGSLFKESNQKLYKLLKLNYNWK